MSTEDIAAIGLSLETDGVEKGIRALDVLASKGPAVEKSMAQVESSTAKTGKTLATLGQGSAATGLSKVGAAASDAARDIGKIDGAAGKTSKSLDEVSTSASLAAKAIGAIGIAGAVRQYLGASDAITTLNNSLKLSTGSTQAAAVAYEGLYEIAQRSRVSFLELGNTYSSISRATSDLGVSQSRMLKVTESIANAMTISGGSAQGMNAALVQLGQGMASGTLRGEELNSILEQAPRLAKALADGLGVPIGKLREMGQAGEITSQQIVKALEAQSSVLSKEVTGATITLSQAFTQLTNSGTKAVGEFDKASGASTSLAQAVSSIASAMDGLGTAFQNNETIIKTVMGSLAGAAALTTLAAVPRAIGAIGVAVTGLSAVLAANPIVLTLLGVGAVVGGGIAAVNAYKKTEDGIKASIRSLEAENARAEKSLAFTAGMGSSYQRGDDATRVKIEERTKAIRALNAELALMSSTGLDTSAEDARLAAGTEQMRAQQRAAEELSGIKQKLNGVDKDYLPTLNKLFAQYQAGAITLKEYQDLVSKLAQNNYKPEKQTAGLKQEQSAYESLISSIRAKIEADKLELSGGAALTESQRIRIKLDQDLLAGRIKLGSEYERNVRGLIAEKAASEAAVSASRALTKASIEAAQARNKESDGITAWIQAQEEAARQAVQAVQGRVTSLRDEEAAVSMAADLNISLAEAIERVAIARMEEKQAGFIEGSEGWKNIQKEIDKRKELASLVGGKAAREATADAAKQAAEDWKRTAEQINQSLTDSLMRGFESGKGFAENLRQTVVNMFKTMVLRPVISAVLSPVSGAIAGVMGGGGGSGSNPIGMASNAYSMYNAGSQAWTLGSQYMAGTMSGANVLGTAYANATGGGIDALLATNGAYGTAPAGAGWMGQLGTAGGVFAAITGLAAAFGAFRKEVSVGGGLSGTFGAGDITGYDLRRESGYLFGGPDYTMVNPAQKIAELEKLRGTGKYLGGGWAGADAALEQEIERLKVTYKDMLDSQGAQSKALQTAYEALRTSAGDMADSLGLGSDAVRAFTTTVGTDVIHPDTGGIGIKLDGLKPEEVQAKIQAALATASNELAQQVIGSWKTVTETVRNFAYEGFAFEDGIRLVESAPTVTEKSVYVASEFAKDGEKAIDTLTRLSTNIRVINGTFENLGWTLMEASLKGADAAGKFADRFGGLEGFAAAASAYYDNFYSEAEKTANVTRDVTAALAGVGLEMPKTRDEFRALVEAQMALGEAGAEAAAELLGLSGAFASVTQSAEEAAAMARASAEKARSSALAQLDASVQRERALWTAQADAAASLRDEVQGIFDTLATNIRDLRNEGMGEALSAAQGRVFITSAQAAVQAGAGLPEQSALADAIAAARGGIAASGAYGNSIEREFAALALAGELAVLQEAAGEQLSTAELQLRAAESQIERLDETLVYWRKLIDGTNAGIDATLSVADAVRSLQGLMFPEAEQPDAPAPGSSGGFSIGGGGGGGGAPAPAATASLSRLGNTYLGAGGTEIVDRDYIDRFDSINQFVNTLDFSAGGAAASVAALSSAAQQYGVSANEIAIATGYRLEDVEVLLPGIPRYKRGTNYVPEDGLAFLHKGEQVLPVAPQGAPYQPPMADNSQVVALLQQIAQRVAALESHASTSADANTQTADVLTRASQGDALTTAAAPTIA